MLELCCFGTRRKEKGKRWQPITAKELEARRQREKSAVLEGSLEHAKTRLANQELKQRNAELANAMQEKEIELQAVRMERAHLNEQHEQWVSKGFCGAKVKIGKSCNFGGF